MSPSHFPVSTRVTHTLGAQRSDWVWRERISGIACCTKPCLGTDPPLLYKMSWFPFKNRASTMPGMNGHLCVFHEACSASSRRVLQGIQQTRSLLSGSLKQPSPNLTSMVPEKCPRIPTSSQTQARLGRAARFQHQEPLLRPPELPGPQPPSSQPGPHPMGPRQSPVWPPGLVRGTSSDSLRWPL